MNDVISGVVLGLLGWGYQAQIKWVEVFCSSF